MNNKAISNIDGQLAYLRPKSTEWEPLTEKSFLLLNPPSEINNTTLTEDDKKKLAQAKQQISEILLKSLQLPNLSFFAGSGTSLAEVKGPSMWDLWRKSMWQDPDSTETNESAKKLKTEAKLVMDKVKYTEVEKPNIEHFLSQCDAYLLFNTDQGVDTYLNKVKQIILHECSSFINQQGCDISAYESLLQKMARRRVRDPRLKVFTTNYDMCFETAASNLGMMIVDGFSYTRKRRFDGRFFNYDVVKRESDNHEFVEGVIHLYKLHGSVSWERNNGEIIESKLPEPHNAVLICTSSDLI